jgi:DNA-binding CsgD family transcriptional regulator/PAS domain-containing protein
MKRAPETGNVEAGPLPREWGQASGKAGAVLRHPCLATGGVMRFVSRNKGFAEPTGPPQAAGEATSGNPSSRLVRRVLECAEPLYDAPTDPDAWSTSLARLTRLLPASEILALERLDDAPSVLGATTVLDTAPNDYAAELFRLDMFCGAAVMHASGAADPPLVWSRALPWNELLHSGMHRLVSDRHGEAVDGLGGSLSHSGQARALLWAIRPASAPFTPDEIASMGLYLRHARRALRLRWQILDARRERNMALVALDALADAIFVVDRARQPLLMNLAAERLVRAGAHLQIADGVLAPVRGDAAWLASTLDRVAADVERGAAVATRCARIGGHSDEAGLNIAVVGLGRESNAASHRFALFARVGVDRVPRLSQSELRVLFGFTVAEANVATMLLQGLQSAEIAQMLKVRPDTVGAHVTNLLVKTQSRRQAGLLVQLARAVPHVRGLGRETDGQS